METKAEIITIKEAAEKLEVSPRTVARAVAKGDIKATFYGLRKKRILGVYAESVQKILAETVKH